MFKKGNQFGRMNKGKSHIAWNKGLTKEIDNRIKNQSKTLSKTLKKQYKNGKKPSRGFLNKKHTTDWKKELSKRVKGNKNPAKKLEVREKIRKYNIGKKYSKETNIKKGHLREKNPNWRGGISFLPYTKDFNKKLKELIKERDKYICQVCKNKGNYIHHINYDKEDCRPENLITLCNSCHCKTNYNRKKWRKFFECTK